MISEGTYGKVYSCQNMVRKVFKNGETDAFKKELTILRKLKPHDNVCRMFASGKTREKLSFILLEALPQCLGDIKSDIISMPFQEQLKTCTFLIRGICNGLEYLNSKNVVHADIKSDNIMLRQYGNSSTTYTHPVLIDFSNSGLLSRDGCVKEEGSFVGGAFCYASPEMLCFMQRYYATTPCGMEYGIVAPDRQNVYPNTDVFSLGGLIYNLMTGLYPNPFYRSVCFRDVEKCYHETKVIQSWKTKQLFLGLPDNIRRYISWMMECDPINRPTVKDLSKESVFFIHDEEEDDDQDQDQDSSMTEPTSSP